MRLFAKIFLCSVLVLSLSLLLSGYLLIISSYENAIKRETERALNQYQYDKFTLQAGLIANAENPDISADNSILSGFASELNGQAAFFSEDKTLLFTELPAQMNFSILDDVSDNYIVDQFIRVKDESYIMICGKVTQGAISLYLLLATDISTIAVQNELMIQSFQKIYIITLGLSMTIIFILSALLTRPINKLTKAADIIARGSYGERLPVSSCDEIGELSASFNLMADAIEDKINELSENARQKEDFVASFAHELKTPLTSVIGYADMLYQKNLSPEAVKNAAGYILSEGLRLEALSLKLMDLIILNRHEFVLEEVRADELLQNIAHGLKPLLEEKKFLFTLEADSGFIKIEYDLFKTLLLNIIDNSIKAGCSEIFLLGKKESNHYCISIADNGRGIPPSEISRITEAFYTVDKSRSRKQHGIGLGLALASKIAGIHGSELRFKSVEAAGTVVEIYLDCRGSGDDA